MLELAEVVDEDVDVAVVDGESLAVRATAVAADQGAVLTRQTYASVYLVAARLVS